MSYWCWINDLSLLCLECISCSCYFVESSVSVLGMCSWSFRHGAILGWIRLIIWINGSLCP